ncbi:hypothetical protein ACRRTK_002724 [Alexandromys fortis]
MSWLFPFPGYLTWLLMSKIMKCQFQDYHMTVPSATIRLLVSHLLIPTKNFVMLYPIERLTSSEGKAEKPGRRQSCELKSSTPVSGTN